MSDHTPTTEDEIRRVMTPLIGWPRLDRWLAEVKAQAWQEGHGYPECDEWVVPGMCAEFHQNPYKEEA
ncbi:hypothetical protein [Timonella senegalensis]|uniref:hypothetical protein n=1 Tax=Timonella senegalensis TaxID=1465825 RepID=UPI002FDE3220